MSVECALCERDLRAGCPYGDDCPRGMVAAARVADREMIGKLVDTSKALRQHLALFCGPDDAVANALFEHADAVIASAQE